MARITEQERRGAVVIDADAANDAETGLTPLGDADSEIAWDDWITALQDAQQTGTIRAHRMPVDADGNILTSKGARQVFLGSWSHQLYSFDELCLKIQQEFLSPGETAHVSFIGTQTGRRGTVFRRILTLQRPRTDRTEVMTGGDLNGGIAAILKVMQDGQVRQAELMERMLTPRTSDPAGGFLATVERTGPIWGPILASVVAAYIGRPAPKSDFESMLGALVKMKDFLEGGDRGGNGGDDDTMSSIIKHIGPGAMQVLSQLAARPPAPAPSPQPAPIRAGGRPPMPKPKRDPVTIDAQVKKPADPTPPEHSSDSNPPETTEVEVDAMLAQLAPHLDVVAQLAESGADPAEVAAMVIDQLPEDEAIDKKIYEAVSDSARFKRLLMLSPRLQAQADWAERLRVALLAEFEADDEDTQTGPG